jgi:hypothetical protein
MMMNIPHFYIDTIIWVAGSPFCLGRAIASRFFWYVVLSCARTTKMVYVEIKSTKKQWQY